MWTWASCVSALQPFYESQDHKTKVYSVTARNPLNRDVIVKQLECETEEVANRAVEEGRIVKANPHPNICECLEFAREGKPGGGFYVYIISPKMQKNFEEDIQERTRSRRPFTEPELVKLSRQLISAYAFLQQKVTSTQQIAHRDIKPQNILLDGEGNAKVCDFGFAKVINLSGPEMHTLLGTLPYFSPLLRKALISGEKDISRVLHNVFKSDVYSLGVCLAYATILEVPSFITTLNRLQGNINDRLDNISKYSKEWVNLLRQMMSVDEALRPDFITLNRSLETPQLFADDEPIQITEATEELQDPLQLSVKCGLSHVRVSPTLFEDVPCMITLKAIETDPNLVCFSNDIVAVIDESGSMSERGNMSATRIQLVQQSLTKLIQMLGDRDRLSIVTFSGVSERKCPLICCSAAGKEMLRKIVAGLRARDVTNISAGMITGMEVLEQRRLKNAGASILLFSDGQNNRGPAPLSACLGKYSSLAGHSITIHVFGYGDDVDSKLLEALSNEGKGVFYHVTEEPHIESAFALTYANITTVVARNLRVRVIVNPVPVRCTIPQIYSKDGSDCFSLPDITANQQKDMIFMLKADYQTLAKASRYEPVTVVVEYDDNEGCGSQRNINLGVKFVPWVDVPPSRDPVVFINWFRVRGANCLREARILADRRQFRDADVKLRNGIEMLQSCGFEKKEYIAAVIRDLESAVKIVQDDKSWQRGGDAHFASISYSHFSQTASVIAMQYSSVQQQRSVKAMNQMPVAPMPPIPEEPPSR